jgi:hypothetical protein
MRQFESIDPENIKNDPRVVSQTVEPEDPERIYYLLIDGDYAILARTKYWTNPQTGKSKWLHYQLEFPKQGLPWLVDTIENKFFKLAKEGGLPAGVFVYYETIADEELCVQRCFGLGSCRETGYAFATIDRRGKSGISKEYSFTDTALFELGLFAWFKDNAERIRRGEL